MKTVVASTPNNPPKDVNELLGRLREGLKRDDDKIVKLIRRAQREERRKALMEAIVIIVQWRGNHWSQTMGCACDQCRIEMHVTEQLEQLLRAYALLAGAHVWRRGDPEPKIGSSA